MNTDKIGPNTKDTATVSGELIEEQLNSVIGGDGKTTTKTKDPMPTETVSLNYYVDGDLLISTTPDPKKKAAA